MSAGNFEDGKYEDDSGNVYLCRRQPETSDLILNGQANVDPTGDIDQPIAARLTGSSRRYGVKARQVRIRFTAAPPAGYSPDDILTVPVFTLDAFNTMKAVRGATGTYLGTAVKLVGVSNESVK